jgi:hypothetical protein
MFYCSSAIKFLSNSEQNFKLKMLLTK